MPGWSGFRDWSLRGKIVALLVAASLLPLGVATWISVRNASADLRRSTSELLQARAQMLVRRIDAFNDGYARIANLLARSAPAALSQSQGSSTEAERVRTLVHTQLQFWTGIDPAIRGVALLDAGGVVAIGSEPALEGSNLSRHVFVREALGGAAVISDVFLAATAGGDTASIGYLAPLRAEDGKTIGAAAIWVDAEYLARLLRELNDASGPGSFAVLTDGLGIRIAHSTRPEALFHPVQQLSPQDIDMLVQEERFGAGTRALVTDVLGVRWDPPMDYRQLPGIGLFQGWSSAGQQVWTVGQRCGTVPWMVFHSLPAAVLSADLAAMVRAKLLFAGVIMLLALATGLLFARAILRPVRQLEAGANAFGAGDLATRVAIKSGDELGRLGATFNTMAGRIQEQSAALRRESADQHRKLFQTMTEAFCTIEMIFDEAGNPVDFVYLETNREFEAQSGLRDVAGQLKSVVVPDLPDYWMQMYGRVAHTGEPVDFEDEDPATGRHYHVRAYRVGGADSRRVAVLFDDITERRQAERRKQAQLESLSLLHRITRAIGERQDLPSIFQVVLRSIEEQLPVDFACICGYEVEQGQLRMDSIGARSLPIAECIPLEHGQRIDIEANGLGRWVQGHLVYEPDIGAVPFAFAKSLAGAGVRALVAAPLQVESRVFGVLLAGRRSGTFNSGDCEFLRQLSEHVALAAHHAQLYTALQQAYAELRETQQAAMQQERLRALGQMASGIAHDINNNISPVALYTDSILEREAGLTEQGRRQLQVVQRAIHDVAATVSRMREFYREREPQLQPVPVQLNELVPQVVELTRARWGTMPQQHGITIEQRTELAPGLPSIMGAESEIREALINLLFNAVDAMPGGGLLTVRTAAVAGQVLIEVRDTGVGMDEDARRRCMEPFFTTKGERGTGLGLAMVYGIAQRHGADIQIESAPGEGTCVRLVFAPGGAQRPAEVAAPLVAPRGLNILVIDDDPVLLRTLREILENEGHMVTAAAGGQEGIDEFARALAAGTPYTVVFTDLGMPQVDGRQVARALKGLVRQVPVIMLTGWGERMVNEGDVPAGVDMMLGKPPRLRMLREALARFCGATAGQAAADGGLGA